MEDDIAPFRALSEMSEVQDELFELFADDIERLGRKYDRETVADALDGIVFDLRNRNAFNTYDIEEPLFYQLLDIKYENDIELDLADVEPEEFREQCASGNPLLASSNQYMTVDELEKAWMQLQDMASEHGMGIFEVFFDLVIFTDVPSSLKKLTEHQHYTREDYIDELMKVLVDRFEGTLTKG